MDCREFHRLLDALAGGELDAATSSALRSHAERCARCGELEALVLDEPAALDRPPPAGLAGAVLARTSGSACDRATGMLPDRVDGRLRPLDAELMSGHLAGCEGCAALERALRALALDLPQLAEIRPDDRFVDDVLARTVPWRRRVARRLAQRWRAVLARPRLAWEGGYLGALLLAVIFGTPGSPLAGVPGRALELARVNPADKLETPVAAIESEISSAIGTGWKATQTRLSGMRQDVVTGASAAILDIRRDLGTLWQRLASEEGSAEREDPAPEREETQGEHS